MGIQERYRRERAQVDEACLAAGRSPEEVLLLAVSKTVDVSGAQEAFAAGARAFGENRPDELLRKASALPKPSGISSGTSSLGASPTSSLMRISSIRSTRSSMRARWTRLQIGWARCRKSSLR